VRKKERVYYIKKFVSYPVREEGIISSPLRLIGVGLLLKFAEVMAKTNVGRGFPSGRIPSG